MFIAFLQEYAAKHPECEIDWLIELQMHIRDGARLRMLDSLHEMEQRSAFRKIDKLADCISAPEPKRDGALVSYAGPHLKKRCRELGRYSDAIEDPANVTELHQTRIAAKRLRYTMEIFAPCFAPEFEESISKVRLLQELLGQVHDCDVWVQDMERFSSGPQLTKTRAEVLRELIADRQDHRAVMYHSSLKHWRQMMRERFIEGMLSQTKKKGVRTMKSTTKMADVDEPADAATVESGSSQDPLVQVEETEIAQQSQKALTGNARPRDERGRFLASQTPPKQKPELPLALMGARESLAKAVAQIEPAKADLPKLAKQLEKLEDVLDKLPKRMGKMKSKQALKTRERLTDLQEVLNSTVGSDGASDKKCRKLRDQVKNALKKLSDSAKL